MDETEKMTALKKAYAEIILNTAKEAAARVIVSERRAESLQRDLSATKDEAIRILLRIKQMIGFKMNEAETRSVFQHKRIDELEAQLHEAEDIVSSLREDLYETQAELERLSRNQQRALDNPIHPEESAQPEGTQEQQGSVKNYGTSGFTPLYEEHCYAGDTGKTDVASIIIRSTEPELYRNGCTQRIRACDRNLPLSEQPDDLKCEKLVEAENGGERIGVEVPTSGEEATENEDNNHVVGKEIINKLKAILRLRNTAQQEVKPVLDKQTCETPDFSQSLPCTSGLVNCSLTETDSDNKANQEPGLEGSLALYIPSEAGTYEKGSVSVAVTDKEMELVDGLVLITQESGSKTDTGLPGSEEEQENPTSRPEKSNALPSDSGEAIPIQSPKDRIVKYTFQRKRKRESISNDDVDSSPQKDIPNQEQGRGRMMLLIV